MSSHPPVTPKLPFAGLPATPRPTRQVFYPKIKTDVDSAYGSAASSATSEKALWFPQAYIDTRQRHPDSMIFVNATIPLSPPYSAASVEAPQAEFDGLAPRKRNAFARLFSCLGREEKARRRHNSLYTQYEKVGAPLHWTEY